MHSDQTPARSFTPRNGAHPKPIAEERLDTDRKKYHFEVHENDRGKYLRIVERCGTRRSSIIIPKESVARALELLKDLSDYMDKLP